MIARVRSYLGTWEPFCRTGTSWLTICVPPTTPTPPAPRPIRPALNRQHWHAHGSDLTSFLDAHPVQE
jgi:hypothetical protein